MRGRQDDVQTSDGQGVFLQCTGSERQYSGLVARDSVGEESYKEFKKYDIGDIVGIEGQVFRTKTGEISIHASKLTLLSKSLQILPKSSMG